MYGNYPLCIFTDSHHNNRSGSFSCSSSNKKITMPKSPDGKLASPRLCLKFHRDHLGGHNNQKSRDSTYSVTNVSDSCIENPMFSPVDSPASSVEGDLYNPSLDHVTHFSGSKVKITIPEDENSSGCDSKLNTDVPSSDGERIGNSLTKEVFPDQGTCDSVKNNANVSFPSFVSTSSDNQVNRTVLKSTETLPFKPSSQFNLSQTDEDSLEELPDLEIDTSDSIPSKEVNSTPRTNAANTDCDSVTSSNTNEANQTSSSQSNVSSSSESHKTPVSQVTTSDSDHIDSEISVQAVSGESVSQSNSVSESSSKPESVNNISNTSEAAPLSVSCTDSTADSRRSDSPAIDPEEVKTDSVKPCSPTRADRESKDSRPCSPKVPPLKIIIPPKSQPSSTASDNNEGLKLVVTNVKSALPYVINPFQDQGSEAEAVVQNSCSDSWLVNHTGGPVSQPVSQSLIHSSNSLDLNSNSTFSDSGKVKKSGSVKGDSPSENVDMEIDESSVPDSGNVKVTQDGDKFSEHGEDSASNSSKCDMDGKRDDKKEEPTQRVLRSAVRSQQQSSTEIKSKQQKAVEKSDKSEKNSKFGTLILLLVHSFSELIHHYTFTLHV